MMKARGEVVEINRPTPPSTQPRTSTTVSDFTIQPRETQIIANVKI